MSPGRELDALVAKKVMGAAEPKYPDCPTCGSTDFCRSEPYLPYSTDIAAAWEVVEKIWNNRGQGFEHLEVCRDLVIGWYCRLAPSPGPCDPFVYEMGDTAPHAICLAALKAVGQ